MSNKLCNKLGNKTPAYLTNRNGIFYFCYRVRYLMLCDGDKTGNKRFYETMIPIAEQEFLDHLDTLR